MKNIEICIKELGCVIVPTKGTSMQPLLKEGTTLVELVNKDLEHLKKGDVILYKKNDGTLVLHRIIKKESQRVFTLLGDHQFKNAEQVNREQIIALAQGFYINGHYVNDETRWYRLYKKIWTGSLTLRRCCLAVLRLKQK